MALPTHNLPISMREAAFAAYNKASMDNKDPWVFYDAKRQEYHQTLVYERYGYEQNQTTSLDKQQPTISGMGRDSDWIRTCGYHPYKESVMVQHRFDRHSTPSQIAD